MGIYYEDLYPLVKPLHTVRDDACVIFIDINSIPQHPHHQRHKQSQPSPQDPSETVSSPRDLHPEDPPKSLLHNPATSSSHLPRPSLSHHSSRNFVIPPINAYGTFTPPSLHIPPALSRSSSPSLSDSSSEHGADRQPLLPGAVPEGAGRRGLFGSVASDLVPFSAVWRAVGYAFGWRGRNGRTDGAGTANDVEDQAGAVDADEGGIQRRWNGDDENGNPAGRALSSRKSAIPCAYEGWLCAGESRDGGGVRETLTGTLGFTHSKHRPRLAGGGENLPLEILRSLSVWVSVLDERGVMPGKFISSLHLSEYA